MAATSLASTLFFKPGTIDLFVAAVAAAVAPLESC
jgi:hypothetical protein